MNTQELTTKMHKHVDAVQRYHAGRLRMSSRLVTWHIAAARGYRSMLTDLALAGDEAAGNAVLGAPHFITFSDGQICQRAT